MLRQGYCCDVEDCCFWPKNEQTRSKKRHTSKYIRVLTHFSALSCPKPPSCNGGTRLGPIAVSFRNVGIWTDDLCRQLCHTTRALVIANKAYLGSRRLCKSTELNLSLVLWNVSGCVCVCVCALMTALAVWYMTRSTVTTKHAFLPVIIVIYYIINEPKIKVGRCRMPPCKNGVIKFDKYWPRRRPTYQPS